MQVTQRMRKSRPTAGERDPVARVGADRLILSAMSRPASRFETGHRASGPVPLREGGA
jgi:hypothetical protein